jgi:hypothetical protein
MVALTAAARVNSAQPEKEPERWRFAMIEATAVTYRQRAKRARAEAAAAATSRSKWEWGEIADNYDKLAAFVERNAVGRTVSRSVWLFGLAICPDLGVFGHRIVAHGNF